MLGAEGALVSVVMPTYNCADFIEESIRSVQGQTHGEWELIVIDDCSTDDTRERVERIAASDPRVHYHLLESNSGAAVARTLGMELARGRFIAFLDSDDLWRPDKLALQLDFLNRTAGTIVCSAYDQIDEAGRSLGRVLAQEAGGLQCGPLDLPHWQLHRVVRRRRVGKVCRSKHSEAE